MGLCNLRHLDEEMAKRRRIVALYRKRLAGAPGLTLCPDNPNDNGAYFPVLFNGLSVTRDAAYARLAAQDIYARKYFYPITSAFECYAGRFNPDETPVAKSVSEKILTLPLYADLSVGDANRICDIILA
jgi:dTDP-4-amino-4,6-dideoxygalactose transaminase